MRTTPGTFYDALDNATRRELARDDAPPVHEAADLAEAQLAAAGVTRDSLSIGTPPEWIANRRLVDSLLFDQVNRMRGSRRRLHPHELAAEAHAALMKDDTEYRRLVDAARAAVTPR
jgi:hypothetical protein